MHPPPALWAARSKLCLSRHHRTPHSPGRARSNAPGLKTTASTRSRTSAKIDPEAPERGCVLVAQGPFSARLAKLLDEQPLNDSNVTPRPERPASLRAFLMEQPEEQVLRPGTTDSRGDRPPLALGQLLGPGL